MRNLLLFLIFVSLINADDVYVYDQFLKTKNGNRCVYDLTPRGDSGQNGWCYKNSSDDQKVCDKTLERSDFTAGYRYDEEADDEKCILNYFTHRTGISYEDMNWLFALAGNLIGFSFMLMSLYLTILISRK